jgi:hypothetical protein
MGEDWGVVERTVLDSLLKGWRGGGEVVGP